MHTDNDGRRDFDFHMRPARIRNRRLVRRLEGCTEWQEFDATLEAQPVIGGLGNIDFFHCPDFPGGPFEGMSIRAFDPRTRLWSIFWLDDRSCALQPPVVGRFEAGRGEFLGDDTFAPQVPPGVKPNGLPAGPPQGPGKPIRVRYIWSELTGSSAHWEQAFSTDGGATWETNWHMFIHYL